MRSRTPDSKSQFLGSDCYCQDKSSCHQNAIVCCRRDARPPNLSNILLRIRSGEAYRWSLARIWMHEGNKPQTNCVRELAQSLSNQEILDNDFSAKSREIPDPYA